jgi:pyruvate/2-oxoglutarate dehydrogenase complex dihydrolipoamide acyltransferase (E2) component
MSQSIEIRVPDIGGFKDVAVIDILVKPGDSVAKDASLITVESDKAAMDIPCPQAGVVEKLLVKVGDKVSEGTPILVLAVENGESEVGKTPAAHHCGPHPHSPPPLPREPTSMPRSWSSAPAPAATPPPSAPPTWA